MILIFYFMNKIINIIKHNITLNFIYYFLSSSSFSFVFIFFIFAQIF